jgi:hypothetical protein
MIVLVLPAPVIVRSLVDGRVIPFHVADPDDTLIVSPDDADEIQDETDA